MKPSHCAFVVAIVLSAGGACAEPVVGAILEQVKPGSMIVRKSDTVPATSATPAASAKKGKAKKVSEPKDKELLGEGADEAATAAVPVTTTPLSGLSSDPSTLQKENALRLGR